MASKAGSRKSPCWTVGLLPPELVRFNLGSRQETAYTTTAWIMPSIPYGAIEDISPDSHVINTRLNVTGSPRSVGEGIDSLDRNTSGTGFLSHLDQDPAAAILSQEVSFVNPMVLQGSAAVPCTILWTLDRGTCRSLVLPRHERRDYFVHDTR